jgi:DNA gyrase subunit B
MVIENKNEYGVKDIVSLSPGASFRQKLGMYLSGDKQEAINLGLRELVVNVQDEYEIYKPVDPFVKITLDTQTKEICVEDNMRGIPVGLREDGINSLTAAMLISHSGAKHNEGSYSSAVGINGIGNKVVCHTAKQLEVQVRRDGKVYSQKFESDSEGAHPITEVLEIGTYNGQSGTRITYVPDERVYGDKFIDIEKLKETLKETSYFTKGLNIILIVNGKKEVFLSNNGLLDGLKEENRIFKPFSFFYETDDCKVELALQWVKSHGQIRGYANGLYMPDGGAFISGFRSSLTRTFNSLSKKQFDGEQIRGVLDGFVSVKVKLGQFSNQAKTALANPEARTATSTAISNALKEFYSMRPADFEKIVEMLEKVEKAEIAAERARQAILNNQKTVQEGVKKKTILAGKLLDCKVHDASSQLIICEGLSASGSLAVARDSDHTAIMPLRGRR